MLRNWVWPKKDVMDLIKENLQYINTYSKRTYMIMTELLLQR